MADDELWKRRFQTFALVRLSGVAIFVLGVVIAFSGIAREGGWPALGGMLAIAGALEAVLVPKLMKRQWDRQ